jgi:hypothetical protein
VIVLVEEQSAGEDREMKNMDCFVETIHMKYRKLKYLHYDMDYIWGLGVDPHLIKGPDASWVSVGVPLMVEGEQHGMIVGEVEEGNRMSLHMVEDIDFHHN